MARIVLVNPPSPEPVRTPLLSFCYLAASLERAGHTVAILDGSAPFGPSTHDELVARIEDAAPDLVGLHLKTLHVQPAYALARVLSERWPLVAGGPHATVRPEEPLHHGFRFVIRGEGEESLVELADAIDGRRRFEEVNALTWKGPLAARHNASRGFLLELDAIASPIPAIRHFEPRWYGAKVPVPPGGLLSSRGCPAACTFCSNDVTGRRFRYRSAEMIAREIAELRDQYDMQAFTFLDDSFAVGRRRMEELCTALERHAPGVAWTCTAHPAHLDHDILRRMKAAGCGGIDIGMESGDPEMLLRIGKGVTVERVLDVLAWARDVGLHMVLNIMFGWPDETTEHLRTTLAFMERAAPLAGAFNARGVLVPYPETRIYEENHAQFGFTDWWVREPPIAYEPFPTRWSTDEVMRAYASDAALDRNFFRHPPEVLALIREALELKARHTFRAVLRQEGRAGIRVPAAGAR